jgi:hypothetical protein
MNDEMKKTGEKYGTQEREKKWGVSLIETHEKHERMGCWEILAHNFIS